MAVITAFLTKYAGNKLSTILWGYDRRAVSLNRLEVAAGFLTLLGRKVYKIVSRDKPNDFRNIGIKDS